MPSRLEQLTQKAKHPPSIANWVRVNDRSRRATAEKLKSLLLGAPKISLSAILDVISAMATDQISLETAKTAVAMLPTQMLRKLGLELVIAFDNYRQKHPIDGIAVFHDFGIAYPIGRGVVIPIRPTFTMRENGKPVPVFVVPWATNPLSDYQQALLTSIVADAILTLEEFQGSHAKFIMLPRIPKCNSRHHIAWRSDSKIALSRAELQLQFDRYTLAVDDVVAILKEMAERGELG
jgi:hypothetical protein